MSEDLREEFLRAMQPQAAKVGVVVRPVDKLAEVVAGVDDPAGESVRRTSDDLIDQLDRSIAISPALLGMSAKRRQPLSALIAPRESLGHGVRTNSGWMPITATPVPSSSFASVSVNRATPALAAAKAETFGSPRSPRLPYTVTMRAPM